MEGYTINIPLEPDSGLREIKAQLENEIIDRIERWEPQILLFSAGFDGHIDDTISQLKLTSQDYYELTRIFLSLMPHMNSPVISFLEGGYNFNALSESVYFHIKALRDD